MYIKHRFKVYYLSLESEQNHSASLRKKDTEYFHSQSLFFSLSRGWYGNFQDWTTFKSHFCTSKHQNVILLAGYSY